MKLSDLLYPHEYTLWGDDVPDDLEVSGICSDSRRAAPGCLFVCLRGMKTDGHRYIGDAVRAGAVAVVAERGASFEAPPGVPVLLVPSTRAAEAFMWSRACGTPQQALTMLAVTGTNGKTSTTYMLRAIFRQAGYKTGLIGTVRCLVGDREYRLPAGEAGADNLQTMTTPDPELLYRILREMADEGVEVVVMEASSHALALSKLDPIRFAGAIFTNLSPEHLDFHTGIDDYLAAKAKLFSMCDIGVFNIDDIYVSHVMQKAPCRRVGCSTTLAADYRAAEISSRMIDGVTYKLTGKNRTLEIKSMIPGMFTVYNTLLAAALALELGVDEAAVCEALAKLPGVDGRLERVYLHGAPFSVFIDYAHTPEAMKNLLDTVRGFCGPGQRIVALFGCGGDRDRGKRAPMGKIASKLADFVIVTSDNSRSEPPAQIIRDILQGIDKKRPYMVIENRREAIEYAIKNALPGDIILLIGKGHENYEINSAGKRPFDERAIVATAYRARGQA